MEIKVKDLLEAFKDADPEDGVHIVMDSGCCGDTEFLEVHDVEHRKDTYRSKGHPNYYSFVQIQCNSIEGYGSCGQVGKTKRDHKQHWMKRNGPYRPWAKITDLDLDQALAWADSQALFATHRNAKWLEHFKRAIGMVNP